MIWYQQLELFLQTAIHNIYGILFWQHCVWTVLTDCYPQYGILATLCLNCFYRLLSTIWHFGNTVSELFLQTAIHNMAFYFGKLLSTIWHFILATLCLNCFYRLLSTIWHFILATLCLNCFYRLLSTFCFAMFCPQNRHKPNQLIVALLLHHESEDHAAKKNRLN